MFDRHWFFDSVPTKDLGITEKSIGNGEDYYVIGGVEGNLPDLTALFNELGLKKNVSGRKFVKSEDNCQLANQIIPKYVSSGKLLVLGTVFYHSQIPKIVKEHPDLYVTPDNLNEKGIEGLQGRAFAQTIWSRMEPLKEVPDLNPVVCLDNEIPAIQDCVKYHFYKQMQDKKPNAKVKVQSSDSVAAAQNEPKGYVLCDVLCSILGNYIVNPQEFQTVRGIIEKTSKINSKLIPTAFDGKILNAIYKTEPVAEWDFE